MSGQSQKGTMPPLYREAMASADKLVVPKIVVNVTVDQGVTPSNGDCDKDFNPSHELPIAPVGGPRD